MDREFDELWTKCEDYPKYAVSNYGAIVHIRKGKELKPFCDRRGFLRVELYTSPRDKVSVYVHNLVAAAFFVDFGPDVVVKHINGVVTDNTVLNIHLETKTVGRGREDRYWWPQKEQS